MTTRSSGRLGLVAIALAGCTAMRPATELDGSVAATSTTVALPCAVAEVLTSRCQSCHGSPPTFGAPMPLVTWADLQAPSISDRSRRVFEMVAQRIHDEKKPMPQAPNPPLDAAETKTLDAWIAAGAPLGPDCGTPLAPPDGGYTPVSCTPDLKLRPATAWVMQPGAPEAYVCYGVEVQASKKRHAIAFAPHPDNSAIIHHLSLAQADAPVSPTPAPCDAGGSASFRPVFGWAPGSGNLELPPAAGFPLEGTTHYVVQIHYLNANPQASPSSDASGFDVCTTDQLRPNDADVMAFGTQSIVLPPFTKTRLACSVQVPWYGATTHLFAAFPHMHALGTSIATIARPGTTGAPVDLGAVSPWLVGTQRWIPIDYTLQPFDLVETHCAWDNTTAATVTFGFTSQNEMCNSFLMYYPRIEAAQWSWADPALASVCVPE
jgi:hypothetical protein